jgi:DNA-binding PadR family transcriptional regulator
MKNRSVTLLALLAANAKFGQPEVHRTVLVKQAFLAETLRPLYRIWTRTFSFVRYYYGPYDEDVFERLDTLVFNGLVEVTVADRRGGRLAARYQVTSAGLRVLEMIRADEIRSLANDLIWALQAIGVQHSAEICELVYQEAEFARIFTRHVKAGIRADTKVPIPSITSANNETFTTLATFLALQRSPDRPSNSEQRLPKLSLREVVRIFLVSLAQEVPRMKTNHKQHE